MHCSARELVCTDGVDDDCDGTTDCDDVDCASSSSCSSCHPTPESNDTACSNGVDDDCDGVVDCRDTDCQTASVDACFGDWIDGSCRGLSEYGTNLGGLQVELTASGLRTVANVTPTGHSPATLEIRGNGAPSALMGMHDLASAPNEYLRTCAHCFLFTMEGITYFPRAGTVTISAVPTAVGQHFTGTAALELEQVTIGTDGEATPVAGGGAICESFAFDGVAVSGGVAASGASSTALGETGAGAHTAEGPSPWCGDLFCSRNETPTNCPTDCPTAGVPNETVTCASGVRCPHWARCLSRGRCACGTGTDTMGGLVHLFGEDGASGLPCSAGHCRTADWSCMNVGCGSAAWWSVPCSSWTCPQGTTCDAAGSNCDCPAGEHVVACDLSPCTGTSCASGWTCSL
jgi:hypothetical protein